MASDTDPYRTLGLPRDASLDQVKRAYRRLAKANHPDAAGPDALPRFLAIQEAYDRIVDGGPTGGGPAGGGAPRRPWEADPTRAGATHRAYGGRTRRQRTTPPPGGPTSGTTGTGSAGAAGGGPGTSGSTGSTGRRRGQGSAPRGAAGSGGATGRSTRPPRPPNKATPGSTSYDGADAEPFEPDWGGASWYGTTSGTYWTLNPKEYADPRKHGPEYQARARRRQAAAAAAEVSTGPAATTGPIPDGVDPPIDEPAPPGERIPPDDTTATADGPGAAAPRSTPPPTHTTASWWEATAGTTTPPGDVRQGTGRGGGDGAAAADGAAARRGTDTPPTSAGGSGLDATVASVRDLLDGPEPSLVARVGRAVVGWAPIALGIGWLMGEASGCARAAATCADELAPIAWIAQAAALVVLLLLPRLATVTAIATAVSLGAAIPGALLLSATGSTDAIRISRTVLGGLLVIAWVVGLVVAGWREIRRGRSGTSGGAGPVS